MANHKSAEKRSRQNINRRIRNQSHKTRIKNLVKKVQLAVNEKSIEKAKDGLDTAKSVIDKAAKKRVIHNNTAARKISGLSRLVNTINA